jgi:hypothetical protein
LKQPCQNIVREGSLNLNRQGYEPTFNTEVRLELKQTQSC